MANTTKKVFQIVINGLTESIDAVKSLNKELDSLGDKIKALDKSTIKVKTMVFPLALDFLKVYKDWDKASRSFILILTLAS